MQKNVRDVNLAYHNDDHTEAKYVRDQEVTTESHSCDDDRVKSSDYTGRHHGDLKNDHSCLGAERKGDGENKPVEKNTFENNFQNQQRKNEGVSSFEITGEETVEEKHRSLPKADRFPSVQKISECVKLHMEKGPPLQSIGKAVPSGGCNVISDLPPNSDTTSVKEPEVSCTDGDKTKMTSAPGAKSMDVFDQNTEEYVANPYKNQSRLSEDACDNILSTVGTTSSDMYERDLSQSTEPTQAPRTNQSANAIYTTKTKLTLGSTQFEASVTSNSPVQLEVGVITPGPRVFELPGDNETDVSSSKSNIIKSASHQTKQTEIVRSQPKTCPGELNLSQRRVG